MLDDGLFADVGLLVSWAKFDFGLGGLWVLVFGDLCNISFWVTFGDLGWFACFAFCLGWFLILFVVFGWLLI